MHRFFVMPILYCGCMQQSLLQLFHSLWVGEGKQLRFSYICRKCTVYRLTAANFKTSNHLALANTYKWPGFERKMVQLILLFISYNFLESKAFPRIVTLHHRHLQLLLSFSLWKRCRWICVQKYEFSQMQCKNI